MSSSVSSVYVVSRWIEAHRRQAAPPALSGFGKIPAESCYRRAAALPMLPREPLL
jgi:hypothetical protein